MLTQVRKIAELKNWQKNLLIFIILLVLILFTQYTLLQPIFKGGLTSDDLQILFDYKTFGPNPWSDTLHIWANRGPYTTSQFYYIGALYNLFGLNYLAFQIINISLKILVLLLIFPLVLIISKNRILAFLTTILSAISYGSTGSLQYVVKGTEYLSIAAMLIFFIIYYYSFADKWFSNAKKYLILIIASLMFLLTFLFSPIRIYPLMIMLPILEIFLQIKVRSKIDFKNLLIKLFIIYLPIFLISKSGYSPASVYLFNGLKFLSQEISKGNWQVILTPFSGLGYTFLSNDYIKLFGQINVDTFRNYLYFLITGPVLVYGFLTILIAVILSRKPKIFFSLVLLTNLIIWMTFFYLYHYSIGLVNRLGFNLDTGIFYTSSMGFYVIIVAIGSFVEWIRMKQKKQLLFLTCAILFSCIFIWSTWLILGPSLAFHYPIHWYLVIPSICSSFFISVLLIGLYNKVKEVHIKYAQVVSIIIILLILFLTYHFSKREIDRHYQSLLSIGSGGKDQQLMQGEIMDVLKTTNNLYNSKPILFYLDPSEDPKNSKFYEVTLFLTNSGDTYFLFPRWLHLQRKLADGCLEVMTDKIKLKNSIAIEGGQKGFSSEALCNERKYYPQVKKVFYRIDNFYALELKDKKLIDIKQQLLKEIGFYE